MSGPDDSTGKNRIPESRKDDSGKSALLGEKLPKDYPYPETYKRKLRTEMFKVIVSDYLIASACIAALLLALQLWRSLVMLSEAVKDIAPIVREANETLKRVEKHMANEDRRRMAQPISGEDRNGR